MKRRERLLHPRPYTLVSVRKRETYFTRNKIQINFALTFLLICVIAIYKFVF